MASSLPNVPPPYTKATMKRHGNLWDKIVDYDNLYSAYKAASKGKSKRREVIEFNKNIEGNIKKIQELLLSGLYTTSKYTEGKVYIPKERTIYKLPFAPDRIVQHALLQVIIPIWDKLLIYDCYACRKNKGVHKASLRVSKFLPKYKYYLKTDISKFYPSINHNILYNIICKKIKCRNTLKLIHNIIYSFPGGYNVPIGNYTSQWFGNLYLNELDQYINHKYNKIFYIRYSDDILVLCNDKRLLNDIRKDMNNFIKSLQLTFSKWNISHTSLGVDFVGYKHFYNKVILRKQTLRIITKRFRNKISKQSIASTIGWLKWATQIPYKLTGAIHERLSEIHQY